MNRINRSHLFLLEFIIIILFFALACSVCVSMFVTARTAAAQSTELSMASAYAQTAAENFKACGRDIGYLEEQFGAAQDGNGAAAYFDRDWNAAAQQDAAYALRIGYRTQGALLLADICVTKDGAEIYRIEAARYEG